MWNNIKAILGLLAFFILLGLVGTFETHYNIEATCLYTSGDMAEYEDTRGMTWTADRNDHEAGDHVTLVMFTNGTDTYISDDEVVRVK